MGLFFERSCPVCQHRARQLCGSCRDLLAHPEAVAPADRPAGLDDLVVLAAYDDVRRIVLALKVDGRRDLVRALARPLAQALEGHVVEALTWIPSAPEHRAERGFDQGRLLARAAARRLDLPARRLLVRRGGTRQGMSAAARRDGPELAAATAVPSRVVVVDDVVTTGASMAGAARALREAGATTVIGVATARARHEVFT